MRNMHLIKVSSNNILLQASKSIRTTVRCHAYLLYLPGRHPTHHVSIISTWCYRDVVREDDLSIIFYMSLYVLSTRCRAVRENDSRANQLFGSGLVFSTGLVWFFVQAWIFAIQARTVWLIILLTITTTVAILSQGYLCAIFVSIPPVSESSGKRTHALHTTPTEITDTVLWGVWLRASIGLQFCQKLHIQRLVISGTECCRRGP